MQIKYRLKIYGTWYRSFHPVCMYRQNEFWTLYGCLDTFLFDNLIIYAVRVQSLSTRHNRICLDWAKYQRRVCYCFYGYIFDVVMKQTIKQVHLHTIKYKFLRPISKHATYISNNFLLEMLIANLMSDLHTDSNDTHVNRYKICAKLVVVYTH